MRYKRTIPAIFLERPNRFVAIVRTDEGEISVHVKNTGRCRELLLPGTRVYLAESENSARKYRYDLVTVVKEREGMPPLWVNIDSQAPNQAAEEWMREGRPFGENAEVRREVRFGDSRLDFMVRMPEKRLWIEVKGCTLEANGIALFPDAPTERGAKHLGELTRAVEAGEDAMLLMILQMEGMKVFRPHDERDPAFGTALRRAAEAGVMIRALGCEVTADTLFVREEVPVEL